MKYILLTLIIFMLDACSDTRDGDLNNENQVNESKQLPNIEDFIGDWYIAAKLNNEWVHIDGCDNYALHIVDGLEENSIGEMSLADRIGLSVDLSVGLMNLKIDDDGSFIFNCIDNYSENKDFVFSGKFYSTLEPWGEEVIELEKGFLWDQLIWEMDGDVEQINLFKGVGARDFPEQIDNIECLDESNFELSIDDIVPLDGITEADISTDFIRNLMDYYGVVMTESENEKFEYISMMEYFILVRVNTEGDYSDLNFYCVDDQGLLLDKRSYSGVFEPIEDAGIYTVDGQDNIICMPGNWVPDEENEIVNLVSNKNIFSIDESGKFVDK